MKRLIPAAALAVLAISAQAQNMNIVEPSFKDYVDVKPGDYVARADAVPASEILKSFPKGSNAHTASIDPNFRSGVASGRSSAELQAGFPQPSFQDHAEVVQDLQTEQVAGRIENRAY